MHHFSCHILRPLIGRSLIGWFLIGCTWALAEALVLGALGGAALSIWLYQNPVISVFLLLTLMFHTLVWPLLAPMMPTACLLELESALKATYPLLEMQSHLSYNSHMLLNGFEREVLALFRMRLNVQRRLILGGYSWKEYFREMWSIWHGAQACRKRFDIFRVELEKSGKLGMGIFCDIME
ncbi:hypothetical protein EV421DRAFT_1733471 [Armillaria borealis]|uniref:Uncharacterized protein n=1 Tax=Armillaria borealis TaxID=47425 RepID=A0AA39JTH3_9AGAR|nr:hypothetical protein EV421DRAFT_1733471 [Armillaria borealis]